MHVCDIMIKSCRIRETILSSVLDKDSYELKVLAEIKFKCRGAFACSKDKNRNHQSLLGDVVKCLGISSEIKTFL